MHHPEMSAAVRAAATVLTEQKPAADDTVRTKAWDPVEVWRKRVLAPDSSSDKSNSKAS